MMVSRQETTQRCLPVISIIKEQIADAKCVLATVGINFDCFNLWQYFINNRHHACMLLWKKIENFPERSYFSKKLIDLFFSLQFLGLNEKSAKIRAGSLFLLAASLLDFALAHSCAAHVYTVRWACLQVNALVKTDHEWRKHVWLYPCYHRDLVGYLSLQDKISFFSQSLINVWVSNGTSLKSRAKL